MANSSRSVRKNRRLRKAASKFIVSRHLPVPFGGLSHGEFLSRSSFPTCYPRGGGGGGGGYRGPVILAKLTPGIYPFPTDRDVLELITLLSLGKRRGADAPLGLSAFPVGKIGLRTLFV